MANTILINPNELLAIVAGILAPNNDTKFLGDASVCTNFTLARELVFEEPETETNWWEIWITTGILAQVFVKFAVTNFGIALYRFADPLSNCAGRFQWPNSERFKMLNGNSEREWRQIRNEKKNIFKLIYLKRSIIWGIIVHLCIFNLIFSTSDHDDEEAIHADSVVFKVTISIAALALLFGFLFSCVKNKEIDRDFPCEDQTNDRQPNEDNADKGKTDGKSTHRSAEDVESINSSEIEKTSDVNETKSTNKSTKDEKAINSSEVEKTIDVNETDEEKMERLKLQLEEVRKNCPIDLSKD